MIRTLALAMVLAGTAAAGELHVFEPEGWLRDPAPEAQVQGLVGARVYHPPGDKTSSLMAGEARLAPGDPAAAAGAMLDQLARDAQKIESRTLRTADGRTIGEIALVDREGVALQARVAAARTREGLVDLAIGVCAGPAIAVCAPKLAWITIEPERGVDVDDSSIRRTLLIGFGIAVGLGVLAGLSRQVRRGHAVRGSAELRDSELVTITGVVRPIGAPIDAPLTGTPCVMYRARARVFTRGAVPVALGEPVETGCAPFVIATSRGDVVVDTSPAVDASTTAIVEHSKPREIAFLARHGFGADRHQGSTFDELAIPPGATIKLRGVVQLERDPDAGEERGYRDDAPMVVKLVSVAGKPLTLLDSW